MFEHFSQFFFLFFRFVLHFQAVDLPQRFMSRNRIFQLVEDKYLRARAGDWRGYDPLRFACARGIGSVIVWSPPMDRVFAPVASTPSKCASMIPTDFSRL